jgi:hypothetical protein
MHDIKGVENVKKKTKDKTKEGLIKQKKQWQDKDTRIKKNTLCPYTGDVITLLNIGGLIAQMNNDYLLYYGYQYPSNKLNLLLN